MVQVAQENIFLSSCICVCTVCMTVSMVCMCMFTCVEIRRQYQVSVLTFNLFETRSLVPHCLYQSMGCQGLSHLCLPSLQASWNCAYPWYMTIWTRLLTALCTCFTHWASAPSAWEDKLNNLAAYLSSPSSLKCVNPRALTSCCLKTQTTAQFKTRLPTAPSPRV